MKNIPEVLKRILLFSILLSSLTCTNPLTPEYQYKEGLIYIEGFLGTTEGTSVVTISESKLAQYYRNVFVSGAQVFYINAETEERIPLLEDDFQYVPPLDFKGAEGEQWYLEVTLPNGNTYRSETETIFPSVPVTEIKERYDTELEYSNEFERFIPGHEILVTFDDPADQDNYYYWRFKTYDELAICKICYQGRLREGICKYFNIDYYTYWCEDYCWQIDYGNRIFLYSDEFSNGLTTSNLPIAIIPLTRKTKILVEIQQYALTPKAYDYYRTIKDLVDNNGGFNSPLPATLIGNMYNPNDDNEFVLGRFTASSAFTKRIFIDRRSLIEPPIVSRLPAKMEPPPEHEDDTVEYYAPCIEGRYRTSIEPIGWIN